MFHTTVVRLRLIAQVSIVALVAAGLAWAVVPEPVAATSPWDQIGADIDGVATNDRVGHAVALSADGSRLAVGATRGGEAGQNAGYVRVYEWSGTTWTLMGAELAGEVSGGESGYAVALSADGTRVAFGARLNSGSGIFAGHARVFEWSGTAWQQLGTDIDGAAQFEQTGYSVALSADGSQLAVGGVGASSNRGVARIYGWDGSAWTQTGTDIVGEATGDISGSAVSLSGSGTRIAVGAPGNDGSSGDTNDSRGQTRVYDLVGSTWTQIGTDLDGEAAGDFSGRSVSLSTDGTHLAVGAPQNDDAGNEAGQVRVFRWSGSAWNQVGGDLDGAAIGERFGTSVSLSDDGNRVAVGATRADAGAVRVFQWSGVAWVQVGADVSGEASDDLFGFSIDLAGDGGSFAAGATANAAGGSNAGHVRVHGSVAAIDAPDAPTGVLAIAGDAEIATSWSAPASPGGSAITGYTATTTPGGQFCTTTGALACTIGGLTNGTSYTVTVTATNSDGTGPPSDPSSAAAPTGAPEPPQSVLGTPGNAEVPVAWFAPSSDGGSPVTAYTVTAAPGGQTCTTTGALTCTVTGLTNGTSYTFTATATNALGTSVGTTSDPVIPRPIPGTPTGVDAVAGDAHANVSWTPPASAASDAITGYTVTSSPDGAQCSTSGAVSCVVANLTNGTPYTFTVTATNVVGTSVASDPSAAVTPLGAPDAPQSIGAVAADEAIVVSWAAPGADGGSPITSYTATATPGGASCATNVELTCTVSGLTNGTGYTVVVTATNALGTSASPAPTPTVTPIGTPGAPTVVVATAGGQAATVSWTAPTDDGGSPISAYTVAASPGGERCSAAGTTSCVVTDLANGTTYTFTVTATNAAGTGPTSTASAPVTPDGPIDSPQDVTVESGDGEATISWDPPDDAGGTIDGYTVTASPGGGTCTTTGETTCTVTGLVNGETYTFTVIVVVDGQPGSGATTTESLPDADGGDTTGGSSGGATQGDIAVLPPCPTPTLPFTDIGSVIAPADVACIYGLGITNGTTPTTYSPDLAVDRNQMASFLARLWRAAELDCPATVTSFADLASAIAPADVACIYGLGITNGTTPTTYSPDLAVDRNQMASFLARLWRAAGRTCPTPTLPFTDIGSVISPADVACIYGLGITNGTTPTTYDPDRPVDRNQMASLLARLWRALGS